VPELTRPDQALIKVLQTAEMAEKVAQCPKLQDVKGAKELLSGGSRVETERNVSCELVQGKAAVLPALMGHISRTASTLYEPHDLMISTGMQHFGKGGLVTKGPCENAILACEVRQGIILEVRRTNMCFYHGKKGIPQPSEPKGV